MATTTNYSWTTPDDTALVKDGASAIRTLGSSVDTTVKNLNPETTLGDLAYRSSTANVKTRLGLGTAGQVLQVNSGATAPEWVAAPTSGGMTLISTTTLSGASITLSSIPQTYNSLYVVIRNWLNANDAEAFYMRFNADSGANRHRGIYAVGQATAAFNGTFIQMSTSTDNAVTQGMGVITIPDYTNATTWKTADIFTMGNDSTTTADYRYAWMKGVYNQTGAITSLQFLSSAGNLTSGTVLLYGVK